MSGEYIHRPGSSSRQSAQSSEPLTTVNHTSFKTLMSLIAFSGQPRIALAGFKSRWNKSEWMQDQWGYLERASLAAASGNWAYCRCGLDYFDKSKRHRFQRCGQVYICPSCNLHDRVEPCEREYLPAFDSASYWYAGSVGWQSSPHKAGLHWVTKQHATGRAKAKKHWRPFAELTDAPHSPRYSLDSIAPLQLMAELPFEFMRQLDSHHWFDGMYCVFEWDFAFYPDRRGTGCFHTALPHLHFFGNRAKPLTYEQGIELYRLYHRTCSKCLRKQKLPSYPDLEIAPITSRHRLKGWMNYQIKSMRLDTMYLEGIRNGCSVTALNLEFHQTVWDAIKLVRSPRKYGNLFVLDPDYIGVRQYTMLTKRKHAELTKIYAELTAKKKADRGLPEGETKQLERLKRKLEHHDLACEQQKQYRLETKLRREKAKLLRPDLGVANKIHIKERGGKRPDFGTQQ